MAGGEPLSPSMRIPELNIEHKSYISYSDIPVCYFFTAFTHSLLAASLRLASISSALISCWALHSENEMSTHFVMQCVFNQIIGER